MTYELKSVPVPDIREFDDKDREKIKQATDSLLNGEEGAEEQLNEAVLEAVGLESITSDELVEMRKAMTHQRLQGEFESEVLLKDIDAVTEWSAEYFETTEEESTLEDFT